MNKPTTNEKAARSTPLRRAALILLVPGSIVLVLWGSFMYAGGYWENLPLLDRISGPQRFREYVVNPIPGNVHSVRGGYQGFPQGAIKTTFSFTGNFADQAFLKGWVPIARGAPVPLLPEDHPGGYQKSSKRVFLLIDQAAQRGYLWVP